MTILKAKQLEKKQLPKKMQQEIDIRESGAMMVELMTSMLIGSLMLSGALTVMLSSSSTYKTKNALADMDERGRMALELIAQDIRRSGYKGCGNNQTQQIVRTFTPDINSTTDSESWVAPEYGIRGWEYSGTGLNANLDLYNLKETGFSSSAWLSSSTKDKGFVSAMLRHSDVIELWPVQPAYMDITSATSSQLDVSYTTPGFTSLVSTNPNQLLLVSDCTRNLLVMTDGFSIGSDGSGYVDIDMNRNNASADQLSNVNNGQAVMLTGVLYYLRIPTGGYRTRPGLYRKEIEIKTDNANTNNFNHGNAQEIIPNILSLQFLYGEAESDYISATRYVTADQVGDWKNVVSVRIYLLLETQDANASPDQFDFTFHGRTYSPENSADKRIRREYTKTVSLRNRTGGLVPSGNK